MKYLKSHMNWKDFRKMLKSINKYYNRGITIKIESPGGLKKNK